MKHSASGHKKPGLGGAGTELRAKLDRTRSMDMAAFVARHTDDEELIAIAHIFERHRRLRANRNDPDDEDGTREY